MNDRIRVLVEAFANSVKGHTESLKKLDANAVGKNVEAYVAAFDELCRFGNGKSGVKH